MLGGEDEHQDSYMVSLNLFLAPLPQGNDGSDGLSAETPVHSLQRAQELW